MDLNHDGTPDAVVVDQSGRILLRLGRPLEPGLFDAPTVINAGSPARSIAILTFAGQNLVTAIDRDTNSVSLYSIAANGTATRTQHMTTVAQPLSIAVDDVDQDGRSDLVVAESNGDVVIFHVLANGGFEALTLPSVDSNIAAVTLTDINHDSLPDIIVTDRVASTASVLLNLGSGHFAPASPFLAAGGQAGYALSTSGATTRLSLDGADAIASGDFNEDGQTDLIVADAGDNSLSLLTGNGFGGFSNPLFLPYDQRPDVVRVADFDGDHHLDLAVLDDVHHSITIFRGDGHGGFQLSGRYDAGNAPTGLSIGDINHDGRLDLIVGNQFGDVMSLLGNGQGAFTPFTRVGQGIAIAVGDLNGDGQDDWVVTDQTRDRIAVQPGGAAAGFVQDRSQGVVAPGAVKMADLNGDGQLDMIVANSGGNNVLVYMGLGQGQFGPARSFYAGTDPADVAVGDVNGDGRLDVVVTNSGSNDVSVLLGDSQTLLRPGPRLSVGVDPVSTQIGDFNGDGRMDLMTTSAGSNQVIMLAGLGGGFFNDAHPTVYNTGVDPRSVMIGQFDGLPGLDLAVINSGSNSISIYSGMNPSAAARLFLGGHRSHRRRGRGPQWRWADGFGRRQQWQRRTVGDAGGRKWPHAVRHDLRR